MMMKFRLTVAEVASSADFAGVASLADLAGAFLTDLAGSSPADLAGMHISFLRYASCAGASIYAHSFFSHMRALACLSYARIMRVYAPLASARICLLYRSVHCS